MRALAGESSLEDREVVLRALSGFLETRPHIDELRNVIKGAPSCACLCLCVRACACANLCIGVCVRVQL